MTSPPPAGDAPPLVIAVAEHGRRIVAACSAEARAAGLRVGMPLAQARILVAGLAVAEADRQGDAALLHRVALFAARRWTPLVATDGADGLMLDIGASAHLSGGEAGLVRRMRRLARRAGLALRIAVAGSVGAAHALARHAHDGVTIVPPGEDAQAVAALPPDALRLDTTTLDALARLGFDRIDRLGAAPRATLTRRFGPLLDRRLEQIAGRRAEPIAPLLPPRPPRARRSLIEPIHTAEAISTVIQDLAVDLCDQLRTRMLGAQRLALVCGRVDDAEQVVTVGLARPGRAPAHLADLLARRIETIDPGFGIETMTLTALCVQALVPEQATAPVGDHDGRRDPDLAILVDRLANRFGVCVLHRAAPAESDAPGRMVARLPPLAAPCGTTWPPDWPRPVRLLRRPQRLERYVAELPDSAPRAFTWRGTRYRVTGADGPERIHGEWWRGGAPYRSRDYFQVEVVAVEGGGGRYWLFRLGDGHDPETGPGDWFVHGAFS